MHGICRRGSSTTGDLFCVSRILLLGGFTTRICLPDDASGGPPTVICIRRTSQRQMVRGEEEMWPRTSRLLLDDESRGRHARHDRHPLPTIGSFRLPRTGSRFASDGGGIRQWATGNRQWGNGQSTRSPCMAAETVTMGRKPRAYVFVSHCNSDRRGLGSPAVALPVRTCPWTRTRKEAPPASGCGDLIRCGAMLISGPAAVMGAPDPNPNQLCPQDLEREKVSPSAVGPSGPMMLGEAARTAGWDDRIAQQREMRPASALRLHDGRCFMIQSEMKCSLLYRTDC